jgi:polyisoprenoid-binding protein YceI
VVSGSAGTATVQGRFTIHGQTRDVSIPIKVQRSGTSVNVVATYRFNWGDYGVQQPSVSVASVQGNPTVEISLVLTSA